MESKTKVTFVWQAQNRGAFLNCVPAVNAVTAATTTGLSDVGFLGV